MGQRPGLTMGSGLQLVQGTARVLQADARALPLPAGCVDLVVTSPPYFAMRSYQDAGGHYAGQVGAEDTPDDYVQALLDVTAECMRVLKPGGSIWVNLGDKYSSSSMDGHSNNDSHGTLNTKVVDGRRQYVVGVGRQGQGKRASTSVPHKSLVGIPWRYALACVDQLGLILRAELVWSKPNGLPESVTDRVRRSHETWFHFTLQPTYYAATDELREPYDAGTAGKYATGYRPRPDQTAAQLTKGTDYWGDQLELNPLGRLPGSVWTIPTEPLNVPEELGADHYAAFPTEWPRRLILGWSPAAVCLACGEGRRPVSVGESYATQGPNIAMKHNSDRKDSGGSDGRLATIRTITGYACACPDTTAPSMPGVVLDPFGGTGTTAMVAKALGREGITVDRSADYCRIAAWRTNDRDQLAKVLRVAKAVQQPPEQLTLWDG